MHGGIVLLKLWIYYRREKIQKEELCIVGGPLGRIIIYKWKYIDLVNDSKLHCNWRYGAACQILLG